MRKAAPALYIDKTSLHSGYSSNIPKRCILAQHLVGASRYRGWSSSSELCDLKITPAKKKPPAQWLVSNQGDPDRRLTPDFRGHPRMSYPTNPPRTRGGWRLQSSKPRQPVPVGFRRLRPRLPMGRHPSRHQHYYADSSRPDASTRSCNFTEARWHVTVALSHTPNTTN